MRLHWRDLGTPRADRADGKPVELAGFPLTVLPTPTADHLLLMAEPGCCQGCATGGVIGIWPVLAYFPNVVAYADGIGRMVDVVGINHVGLGTDQLGLPGGSALPSYADLPQLAAALRSRFTPEETAKLLGGNYRRVFAASMPS